MCSAIVSHLCSAPGSRGEGETGDTFFGEIPQAVRQPEIFLQPLQKLFLGKEGFDLCPDNSAHEQNRQAVKVRPAKSLAFVLAPMSAAHKLHLMQLMLTPLGRVFLGIVLQKGFGFPFPGGSVKESPQIVRSTGTPGQLIHSTVLMPRQILHKFQVYYSHIYCVLLFGYLVLALCITASGL